MNRYFTARADKEYKDWQKNNINVFSKINDLADSIEEHGILGGIGKPEQLRHYDSEDLDLNENDVVDFEVKGNVLMIKKLQKRGPKTIEERFEEFYGTDFETAISDHPYDYELIDWGPPIGDEMW